MKWHRFGQLDNNTSNDLYEFMKWTNVMPGDVVQSWGTYAWNRDDFRRRYDKGVKHYRLKMAPVLVLSRIPGIPGEEGLKEEGDLVTFTCLSRHGIIVVLGDLGFGRTKNV